MLTCVSAFLTGGSMFERDREQSRGRRWPAEFLVQMYQSIGVAGAVLRGKNQHREQFLFVGRPTYFSGHLRTGRSYCRRQDHRVGPVRTVLVVQMRRFLPQIFDLYAFVQRSSTVVLAKFASNCVRTAHTRRSAHFLTWYRHTHTHTHRNRSSPSID